MKTELVIFDMAGTTVDDIVDGVPLVLKSYKDAFRNHGIHIPISTLNRERGRDKRTVIREYGGTKAAEIYRDFKESLIANAGKVRGVEGVEEVFRFLRDEGIKVTLSTGFPSVVAMEILESLGWVEEGLVGYWVCSEMVGASRPSPAMIHRTMRHFCIRDPGVVVKVDDTAKGIEEGRKAKAYTIGVLTGTQTRDILEEADPDAILPSIRELPGHLEEEGRI
jgi:phosphonatase-like hydrolase